MGILFGEIRYVLFHHIRMRISPSAYRHSYYEEQVYKRILLPVRYIQAAYTKEEKFFVLIVNLLMRSGTLGHHIRSMDGFTPYYRFPRRKK